MLNDLMIRFYKLLYESGEEVPFYDFNRKFLKFLILNFPEQKEEYQRKFNINEEKLYKEAGFKVIGCNCNGSLAVKYYGY